jgi:hypothetical protein
VGFTPIEEARFFYSALEIKESFNIKGLPGQNQPKETNVIWEKN